MNRSDRTHFSIQLLIIGIFSGSLNAQSDDRPPMCLPGLIVDCDRSHENIIWATDANEQQCRVIKNRCIFNNIQCYYFKNRKPLLKETTKEKCQELCNECNRTSMDPVCAKRDGKFFLFTNRCALERHMCCQGESWTIELKRFCDERSLAAKDCPEALT